MSHVEDAATVLTHLLADATYMADTLATIAGHITESDPEALRQLGLIHPELIDTLIRMTHNLDNNMCYRATRKVAEGSYQDPPAGEQPEPPYAEEGTTHDREYLHR